MGLPPGAPFWSDDSNYIYFTGGIGGTTHLFRVPSAGGAVEQITKGERRLGGFSYDKAHTKMAYTVGGTNESRRRSTSPTSMGRAKSS